MIYRTGQAVARIALLAGILLNSTTSLAESTAALAHADPLSEDITVSGLRTTVPNVLLIGSQLAELDDVRAALRKAAVSKVEAPVWLEVQFRNGLSAAPLASPAAVPEVVLTIIHPDKEELQAGRRI